MVTKKDFEKNGIKKGSKLEVMVSGFANHEINVMGYVARLDEKSLYLTNTWDNKEGKPLNLYHGIEINYTNIESWGEQELLD